jgi:hypothetical protein
MLTHVAERFDLFPGMGWGLPNSPGHYLDLAWTLSRSRERYSWIYPVAARIARERPHAAQKFELRHYRTVWF